MSYPQWWCFSCNEIVPASHIRRVEDSVAMTGYCDPIDKQTGDKQTGERNQCDSASGLDAHTSSATITDFVGRNAES
jgi:hypothetical protein